MVVFNPTPEQRPIVDTDASALIIAGPGKGKSATAIAAANAWLDRHPGPGKVLFSSFSNAAVKRIAATAGLDLSQHAKRLAFRTFHSVAFEILQHFGRFAGIKQPVKVVDRTEQALIAAERGWGKEDGHEAHLRQLALEEGQVGFELMIPMAIGLLRASPTIRRAVGRRFPFIVVDEFQDTKPEQWEFLKLLGEQSRVVALGDPDQMIYAKQHAEALQRLAEFEAWKGVQTQRFMGKNHRCGVPGIIAFAEALLHGVKKSPSNDDGVQVFSAYQNQRRAALTALWLAIRKQATDTSTIAFIVPSAGVARSLAAELRQPAPGVAIPVPVHAHIEIAEDDLDTFRFAAFAAADWVADRTEERLNRLAIALAVFMRHWSRKKSVDDSRLKAIVKRLRTGSTVASPARVYLEAPPPASFDDFAEGLLTAMEADDEFGVSAKALRAHGVPRIRGASLGQADLFGSYRDTRLITGLEGTAISRARTNMVSMYKSKGREFDFVVLVVDPRMHSKETSLEELRRLYYVAATRARHWLGILHAPKLCGPVLGPVLNQP